jgi:hypothetical protein
MPFEQPGRCNRHGLLFASWRVGALTSPGRRAMRVAATLIDNCLGEIIWWWQAAEPERRVEIRGGGRSPD